MYLGAEFIAKGVLYGFISGKDNAFCCQKQDVYVILSILSLRGGFSRRGNRLHSWFCIKFNAICFVVRRITAPSARNDSG